MKFSHTSIVPEIVLDEEPVHYIIEISIKSRASMREISYCSDSVLYWNPTYNTRRFPLLA